MTGLAGPLLMVLGWSMYDAGRRYTAHGLPLEFLILATGTVWLAAGLSTQMHLHGDRPWNAFLRQMPIPPGHILAVHVWTALPLNLAIVLCLVCSLAGAEVSLWGSDAVRWLVVLAALTWAVSLQVAMGFVRTRLPRMSAVMLAGLLGWLLVLVGRAAWKMAMHSGDLSPARRIVEADSLLWLIGAAPLARALTLPAGQTLRAGLLTAGYLAMLSAAGMLAARRLAIRPAHLGRGASLSVRLTGWVRPVLSRGIAGPRGGQVCIEWLRTFRSGSGLMAVYMFASVVGSVVLGGWSSHSQAAILVLVFAAVAMMTDCVPSLVRSRTAGRLYDLYGTDTRDFLYGLITSIGVLVSTACLCQVPVYLHERLPGWRVVAVCCTFVGISFAMVGLSVAFNWRLRMGFPGRNPLVGFFGRVLILGVLMLFAFALFLLGQAVPLAPVAFAVAYVVIEARRASRLTVRRRYWGLQNDPTPRD